MSTIAGRRLRLPEPAPHTGADRCPTCRGAKVTAARYDWTTNPDTGTVLVLDELCPACDGCGRDSAHASCEAREHADWQPGHDEDEVDDPGDDETDLCPSCHGRTWWAMQGFAPGVWVTMRVPCGCAESLLVEAS